MSNHPQNPGTKGSLKHIQRLVNDVPGLLENEIKQLLPKAKLEPIQWVSPLASEGYTEYRDDDFLRVLGLSGHAPESARFWPRFGPQWDALGRSAYIGQPDEPKQVFLIEAKAHVREIVSTPCKAASQKSASLIRDSLEEVKDYVHSASKADWAGYFYQYTNRLAHLYFLREKLGADAYLVFVYFVGDAAMHGPRSRDEWESALTVMKRYLGIDKKHRLSKYMLDVFVDVRDGIWHPAI